MLNENFGNSLVVCIGRLGSSLLMVVSTFLVVTTEPRDPIDVIPHAVNERELRIFVADEVLTVFQDIGGTRILGTNRGPVVDIVVDALETDVHAQLLDQGL